MSVKSMSMDLIPYTPPKTPMEFVRAEVEKNLKNDTMLSDLALSLIAKISAIIKKAQESSLSSCKDGPISRYDGSFTEWGREEFYTFQPTIFGTLHGPSSGSSYKKLNGDEIAEALQSEVAFTIATDKKPIVATYGAASCVALGGYDETNKIAFVVHFSNKQEVIQCGGVIFYNISKLAKEKLEKPIQLHLRGGMQDLSETIVEAIKVWMRQRDDLPMEIASEDILDNTDLSESKSLAIDSRTGEVSTYDPKTNPQHRNITPGDEIRTMMSLVKPNITIAYLPQ